MLSTDSNELELTLLSKKHFSNVQTDRNELNGQLRSLAKHPEVNGTNTEFISERRYHLLSAFPDD